MAKFVIATGAAPHMKLSRSGREFTAIGPFMTFDSHDSAYDYIVSQTDKVPLKGIRAEILEDLSL
ncbi:MAG: hypothetical protein ACK4YU_06320 [Paracoccus sp. (in: a-proteobacteria)]